MIAHFVQKGKGQLQEQKNNQKETVHFVGNNKSVQIAETGLKRMCGIWYILLYIR